MRRDGRECRLRLGHAWSSHAPRSVDRGGEQKRREQIGRAGKIPATIRTDKTRKHRCEQNRSDHECDAAETAECALKLSLLRRTYSRRHHALHRRGPEAPPSHHPPRPPPNPPRGPRLLQGERRNTPNPAP